MVHKKIFEAVLSDLDGERARYFTDIANKLEEDPRAQKSPNLVFLVLRDSARYLPDYLPAKEFVDVLLSFVKANSQTLSRIIYSREFVTDPMATRAVSRKFVSRVLEVILEKHDDGSVQDETFSVHHVTWPYDNVDFPYLDADDDD